ncbi:hypothetical protein [Pseudomonas sp. GV047]|uniref:hypothetical protein n=1 Tax=Pseudomonas sp. GV047 TaxID=2135751 RepID=UPI001062193D|nr:hypothetical protein [Pseudomonas sp. GV047]
MKEPFSFLGDENGVNAFFVSGRIFSISEDVRSKILSDVISGGFDIALVEKACFFKWAMERAEKTFREAELKIKDVNCKEIISHLETLILRMEVYGVSIDGRTYAEDVLNSQASHLVSTLTSVLYLISKRKSLGENTSDHQRQLSEFWAEMAHYESLKEFIQEASHGNCIPVDVSVQSPVVTAKNLDRFVGRASYFMDWYDHAWRNLEIYRDLNYKFYSMYEGNADELYGLMSRSGMGKLSRDVMRIDLSRGDCFEDELLRYKIIKRLELMYSSDGVYSYKGEMFTIKNLLESFSSLLNYARIIDEENRSRIKKGGRATVRSMGLHRICRLLKIPVKKKALLDVFICDLNISGPSADIGIYMLGQEYYVIPSHVLSLCFEKVIDRILVRGDVSLLDSAAIDKGYFFESEVKRVVEKSGRAFYKLNRDVRKGAPEIDGVFNVVGPVWAICEVKCSIKPECRRDAYQFTENHLVGALTQLDERYDYLKKTKNVIQGFAFGESEVLLLIITNHNYFTGLNLKTSMGRNVHVVDYLYLHDLLVGGFVPAWSYNGKSQKYLRSENLVVGLGLVEAIKNPIGNLICKESDSFQIQKSGIAIRIHKESVVDEMSFYDESVRETLSEL